MANNQSRVGAVPSSDPRAAAQAASIGATIGGDGSWYIGTKKLSHGDADALTRAKGTAIDGLQEWGLGKGTLGDVTGGRAGDVHLPPAVAEAARIAATAGGTMLGIPPQVTGALAANLGKGPINNVGTALTRGLGGALQGAAVGGAVQGFQGGSGILNGIKTAGQGALKGAANPLGDYTKGLPAVATVGTQATAPTGADLNKLGDSSYAAGGGGIGDWLTKNLPGVAKMGSKVGDVLTGNNGLNALAAAQIANAAYNGKKSGDYADSAMKSTQGWWDQRAPLRAQGIAGMQAAPTQLPQLSAISAAGNPFARQG